MSLTTRCEAVHTWPRQIHFRTTNNLSRTCFLPVPLSSLFWKFITEYMDEDVSRGADVSYWWPCCVLAGIWFLHDLGSQDYKKPEQNLAKLLRKECANSTN